MIVAVNTRFLLKDYLEGYGYFIRELFTAAAIQHPEHQFYFIFDRPYSAEMVFPANVKPVVAGPPARHPLLWRWWYNVTIPRVLRQIEANVFVSPDGFCSLTSRIPQCLIVHDLGFLHHPKGYKTGHVRYYRLQTPRFIRKARVVATVSKFSRHDIAQQYNLPEETIRIVPNAAKPVFKALGPAARDGLKERYTEGREYFVYVGSIHPRKNLVGLLKAFSIFKKRQQTSMKLVLVGRMAWKNEEFTGLLSAYKFRKDVVVTGYLAEEELAAVLASAYAMVYPSVFEGFGVPVLEAMNCEVPVLTSAGTAMQEYAGDAALYFDPAVPASIAEKLMLIYKDEQLRNNLIRKGTAIAAGYSWERSAAQLWECIKACAAERP